MCMQNYHAMSGECKTKEHALVLHYTQWFSGLNSSFRSVKFDKCYTKLNALSASSRIPVWNLHDYGFGVFLVQARVHNIKREGPPSRYYEVLVQGITTIVCLLCTTQTVSFMLPLELQTYCLSKYNGLCLHHTSRFADSIVNQFCIMLWSIAFSIKSYSSIVQLTYGRIVG